MRKVILSILTAFVLFNGCEKIVFKNPSGDPLNTDKTPPTVILTDPATSATGITLNKSINITFSEEMDSSTITSSTITLMQGTTPVAATVSYTGTKATLTLTGNLTPNKVYTGTVTTGAKDLAGNALSGNYTFNFTTGAAPDVTPPVVSSSDPANSSTTVALSKIVTVTFNEAMDPLTITASTFTLKQGSTAVTGTVTYTGTQASFVSSGNLLPNTVYTGTITTGAKDVAGNAMASNYTFSFTTTSAPDITPPTITSTDPSNSATGVAITKVVNVIFSKALNATTVTSSTFTLKQGSTTVAGNVTFSGSTASFTPSASFAYNTTYTGTLTTGIKDVAGNALASNYTFSFTTGAAPDLTPPTVVSTNPASNATGVATSQVVGITFSEAMTASSITTSTFTLKNGSTAVAGTVNYSGTTATFTPSAALAAGTVYTASMSTGAKDVAGNMMMSAMTWNFTTTGPPGLSFANDVIPVLNMCESCHRHGWTSSSNASTYYNNLVSRGYVKPTSYTSSTIYSKLQSGHPGSGSISKANTDKIINWMIQGSLNN
jgi:methionine-rich copper-binding protein CopC